MPSIPIHCKCMGGWFVLKSIAHGSKCPFEKVVCSAVFLPYFNPQMSHWVMFTYRCWSEILSIDENLLGIPASFAGCNKPSRSNCTCLHVNVRCETCQDSQHSLIIYQHFPSRNICDLAWRLLLICLLELGFGFENSLPRGQPVGKSPYYRSFDHSANWHVKDSISFALSMQHAVATLPEVA